MPKKILIRSTATTRNATDAIEQLDVSAAGALKFDSLEKSYYEPRLTFSENWEFLPVITTVVATSAKAHLVTGTNAVSASITRATKGGIKVSTAGATSDSTVLNAQTGCPGVVLLSATNAVKLRTQVAIGQLADCIVRIGFAVSASATDPAAIAGTDSVQFVFDYSNAMTTGLAAAVYQANWLVVTKAASGTAVFTNTGIPVIAAREYELRIEIGTDLLPLYYIDNVLVYTGVTALGAVTMVQTQGIKNYTNAAATFFSSRYVDVSRLIA